MTESKTLQVQRVNDAFRRGLRCGMVAVTRAVHETFRSDEIMAILELVKAHDHFTPDNDPYNEHDFGVIEYREQTLWFKISYYDRDLVMHSPDPADEEQTVRVLTVLFPEDW